MIVSYEFDAQSRLIFSCKLFLRSKNKDGRQSSEESSNDIVAIIILG